MDEESREWDEKKITCFIDFEEGFNSVDQNILWMILKHCGWPDTLVKIEIALDEKTECCGTPENRDMPYCQVISDVKH